MVTATVFAWIVVEHYRKRAERRRRGLPVDDPSERSIWEIFIPLLWIASSCAAVVLGAYVGSHVGGSFGRRVGAVAGLVASAFSGVLLLARVEQPNISAREVVGCVLLVLSAPVGAGVGAYVHEAGYGGVWFGAALIWLAAVAGLAVVFLLGLAVLFVAPQKRPVVENREK